MNLQPIISEKSMRLVSTSNQYAFTIPGNANKIEVARAVEAKYNVPVEKVRTQVRSGKLKRSLITRTLGRRPARKIAYVTLPEGESIDEFDKELEG